MSYFWVFPSPRFFATLLTIFSSPYPDAETSLHDLRFSPPEPFFFARFVENLTPRPTLVSQLCPCFLERFSLVLLLGKPKSFFFLRFEVNDISSFLYRVLSTRSLKLRLW